ncbi:MAG: helix-turn-helix transcriptional regulator [Symploca sp. SIO2G7]|nr:helix-turn-helix transcriptional regulator [Symploca sp. SIO2G7]
MQLILPRENWLTTLEEWSLQNRIAYTISPSEFNLSFSETVAEGAIHWLLLRPGLKIQIDLLQTRENVELGTQLCDADPLQFSFCLAGLSRGRLIDTTSSLETEPQPGQNLLMFNGISTTGYWECLANQSVQIVEILVEPWLLLDLIEHSPESPPLIVQQILTGKFVQPCFLIGVLTPAMRMTVHQILHCPYKGISRHLFLESKAIELIALKLAQMGEQKKFPRPNLKTADIERIYYASSILRHNLEHPPSLIELAKQVGLNDYKLKQGFHQVFGTTVFGYLRAYRMEQARQWLVTQQMNVSEAAHAVGYVNVSRFSSAFKRQFGILPSDCLDKKFQ